MSNLKYYVDQRKYYFLGFRDENFLLKELIRKKSTSFEVKEGDIYNFTYSNINRRQFGINSVYENDNNPNFEFGCFLIEDKILKISIVIAPYAQILEELFYGSETFNTQNCLKVNLYKLLDEVFNTDVLKDRIKLTINGVEIGRSGANKLSNIMIKGSHPFDSEIGRMVYDLIKGNITGQKWSPLNCKLAITFDSDFSTTRRQDISLLIDKSGLMSFHMRANYKSNTFVLFFINFIIKSNYEYNAV